ncbi:MAG: hypothetical protein JHC87_09315, partial [Thermoleophilaceae bacterium]|nr:hypothetical protein [Thermoleophilaceae bacterium]
NIKPSRFGPVSALLAAIEYCQQHDIEMYSGGQYELGVGRGHLHVVASLFFPDSPNDAAPVEYHAPQPVAGVPQTPLAPPAQMHGFRW